MNMEQKKINIAELLKDCPKGMELDCVICDNCTLETVFKGCLYPIQIQTPEGCMHLTKYGSMSQHTHSKCVIFPKGKTTWEGFISPCKFKDGDVICVERGIKWVAIVKSCDGNAIYEHAAIASDAILHFSTNIPLVRFADNPTKIRFATEEEKAKLFQAIKDNGYNWNAKTKTLEKLVEPKFKVGDIIQDEDGYKVKITEVNIEDECYGYESIIAKGIGGITFSEQDNWELVPNKFDITTLEPFDKVLVRIRDTAKWIGDFYLWYDDTEKDFPYRCAGSVWPYCIPYESNEHLLGTTNDCDEFYKTLE